MKSCQIMSNHVTGLYYGLYRMQLEFRTMSPGLYISLHKSHHGNSKHSDLRVTTKIGWIVLSQPQNTCNLDHHCTDRHEKKCQHRRHAGGTFWIAGEHFGPKFRRFCCNVKFVGDYAILTLFLMENLEFFHKKKSTHFWFKYLRYNHQLSWAYV